MNDSVMLHAKWPGHTPPTAFWRPRPLDYFLPPVSQVERVEFCLLHMVLDRELDCGWEYTQKYCHDFCLSLLSFFSEPSLTYSLSFLTQQYCLSDDILISFVTSSKSPASCCDNSFDLAIHFSWLATFTGLSIACPRKTYSNLSNSWKP